MRYSIENVATIVPHTTGYFKIYISDYHGPILGSPFYVLINPQREKSELDYVESSGIRDAIKNEEATFVIRNKDMELDVQIKSINLIVLGEKKNQNLIIFFFICLDPNDEFMKLKKKRTLKGYLQVSYIPELIGKLRLV